MHEGEREELLNKVVIFVLFVQKYILVATKNYGTIDITWTISTMSLLCFMGLESFQLCRCICKVRELFDFIKNILICVPKMNLQVCSNMSVSN